MPMCNQRRQGDHNELAGRRRRCVHVRSTVSCRQRPRRLPRPPCRRLLCLLGHLSPRDNPSATVQQQRRQWRQSQQVRALHSSSTLGRAAMEEPATAAAAAEKARAKAAVAQAVHPSPSAKHLSQLTNILNARDLAEASPKLKPGERGRQFFGGWVGHYVRALASLPGRWLCVYKPLYCCTVRESNCCAFAGRLIRSGSPAHASLEDVLLLRRELHVQQVGLGRLQPKFDGSRTCAAGRQWLGPARNVQVPALCRAAQFPAPCPTCKSDCAVRHPPCCPRLQLVDFRSSEEHKEDTAWSLMLSNGVIKTYDSYGAVVEVRSGWGVLGGG